MCSYLSYLCQGERDGWDPAASRVCWMVLGLWYNSFDTTSLTLPTSTISHITHRPQTSHITHFTHTHTQWIILYYTLYIIVKNTHDTLFNIICWDENSPEKIRSQLLSKFGSAIPTLSVVLRLFSNINMSIITLHLTLWLTFIVGGSHNQPEFLREQI